MKSTEIYKIISRDPDAEFAIKPRLSHFPRGVTLVRGLERADLPGLWKYREVRYQMSDQWVVPEPDRVFPEMHMKVKSRDLMDADQARAMVRKQVGEFDQRAADKAEKEEVEKKLRGHGVDACVHQNGRLEILDWRALDRLLSKL